MFASATNNVLVATVHAVSRRWMGLWSNVWAASSKFTTMMVMSIYCTARVEFTDCSLDWLDCLTGISIYFLFIDGATYQIVPSWFSPRCRCFMEPSKLTKNISAMQMDVYILRTRGISVLMQTDEPAAGRIKLMTWSLNVARCKIIWPLDVQT